MNDFLAYFIFLISLMITPGPNNLMMMHSGLNFGIKRSIPHFFGVLVGVVIMLTIVALGFGYVFQKAPWLHLWIKIIGSIYMLYLAWKISQMNEKKTDTNIPKPLTFWQAVLFQWVNPKAWIMCIAFAGMLKFSSSVTLNTIALVSTVTILNIPCLSIWIAMGTVIEKIINTRRQRKMLNAGLGALLVVSIVLLWT